jgi:hypothetical protein
MYKNYDQRYQHVFKVTKLGDGLIQVQKPANHDQHHAHPKPLDLHIERNVMEICANCHIIALGPPWSSYQDGRLLIFVVAISSKNCL